MDRHQLAGLKRALMAGIFANLGVAIVKFVAFSFTSSAAMLAEAVHSVADSSNQALLFLGIRRGARPPTDAHPLGHSTERYFWTFVVAINIFVLGALVAIYEGVEKIRHPHPAENLAWSFGALGIAMVFEAFALRVAWKEFQHFRAHSTGSLWRSLRAAKDLSLPTILFEDSAALLGLLIATAGTALTAWTHDGLYDGLASVMIGGLLLGVAWFLATESHSLLIGEAASPRDRRAIREVVEGSALVTDLVSLTTLHRGPDDLLVALEVEFRDDLVVTDLEREIPRLEDAIRERVPAARTIFVEARALMGRRVERGSSSPPSA